MPHTDNSFSFEYSNLLLGNTPDPFTFQLDCFINNLDAVTKSGRNKLLNK